LEAFRRQHPDAEVRCFDFGIGQDCADCFALLRKQGAPPELVEACGSCKPYCLNGTHLGEEHQDCRAVFNFLNEMVKGENVSTLPECFVMENSNTLTTARHRHILEDWCRILSTQFQSVKVLHMDKLHYGIAGEVNALSRERVYLVAFLDGDRAAKHFQGAPPQPNVAAHGQMAQLFRSAQNMRPQQLQQANIITRAQWRRFHEEQTSAGVQGRGVKCGMTKVINWSTTRHSCSLGCNCHPRSPAYTLFVHTKRLHTEDGWLDWGQVQADETGSG
jgi:site-specific DNA-cytosine methylase